MAVYCGAIWAARRCVCVCVCEMPATERGESTFAARDAKDMVSCISCSCSYMSIDVMAQWLLQCISYKR